MISHHHIHHGSVDYSLLLKPVAIILTILMFHTCVCIAQEDNQEGYNRCKSNFVCGNRVNVSYPFWGDSDADSRPEYCGLPGYKLKCSDGDVAEIEISDESYRVLEINPISQVMTITNKEFVDDDDACPTKYPIAKFESPLFNDAPDVVQLFLYFDCPRLNLSDQFTYRFKCNTGASSTPTSDAYFWFENARPIPGFTPDFSSCTKNVQVHVMSEALGGLMAEPQTLPTVIKQGFNATYVTADSGSSIGMCVICSRSGGACGYNNTAKTQTCFCSDGSSGNECGASPAAKSIRRRKILIGLGVVFGVVGIILSISILIYFMRKKRSLRDSLSSPRFLKDIGKNNHQDLEAFFKTHGSLAPKRYSFKDVKKMTNSFKEKLGQGGYGSVFKGKLNDGRLVAVKVLFNNLKTNNAGVEFINEVASISRTSHVNIVTLLGFCYDKRNKRALIYEFMPNGSLEKFIYGEKLAALEGNLAFGWETVFQVAIEIARGLEYLHRGCTTRILHFDIKPHNILLDEGFRAKISDFGLAKLCLEKESFISMSGARGTAGYIAPEVFNRNFGVVSNKSDVYSYGMMILEMVGGRKNIDVKVGIEHPSQLYFPHQIYDRIKLNEDLGLHGIMTEERKEAAKKMIIVGLWCIQTNPLSRPSMSKVLEMLEGSLDALEIPPKPFLSSPPRSPQPSISSSTSAQTPSNMEVSA